MHGHVNTEPLLNQPSINERDMSREILPSWPPQIATSSFSLIATHKQYQQYSATSVSKSHCANHTSDMIAPQLMAPVNIHPMSSPYDRITVRARLRRSKNIEYGAFGPADAPSSELALRPSLLLLHVLIAAKRRTRM